MNATSTSNMVTAAAAAESRLVVSIHAAADALDTVATNPVQEALERLASSAQAAKARLQAAACQAAGILSETADSFDSMFNDVAAPTTLPIGGSSEEMVTVAANAPVDDAEPTKKARSRKPKS